MTGAILLGVGLLVWFVCVFWAFRVFRQFRRRLEAVEAGHVHGNVNDPARDYTEAELLECESGARTIARSCRCLGILHGARRVVDLSMLPPRDPHFARPVRR